MSYFKMDPTDALSFFRLLERGYHSGNPYHNALHASDVTQEISGTFVIVKRAKGGKQEFNQRRKRDRDSNR